jgi:hypothetical protein
MNSLYDYISTYHGLDDKILNDCSGGLRSRQYPRVPESSLSLLVSQHGIHETEKNKEKTEFSIYNLLTFTYTHFYSHTDYLLVCLRNTMTAGKNVCKYNMSQLYCQTGKMNEIHQGERQTTESSSCLLSLPQNSQWLRMGCDKVHCGRSSVPEMFSPLLEKKQHL